MGVSTSIAAASSLVRWLLEAELVVFFAGLFGLIGFRLLTGRIRTRRLLYGARSDGSRYLSPERIQLLVFTLGVALQYLLKVVENPGHGFPPVPQNMLNLLMGSNAVYLGGKSWTMILRRLLMERN